MVERDRGRLTRNNGSDYFGKTAVVENVKESCPFWILNPSHDILCGIVLFEVCGVVFVASDQI